ncbi:MAG: ribonucleoside reductase class II [Candidatus Omnitrophica bacterium 4484_70.2]|nr:MAG: ribonucleoside reductase class II [Candidatus Omnitrophica bacterium 4484_70.2]
MKDRLNFSDNALVVLKKRYLKKNERGEVIETPYQMVVRVVSAVSKVEKNYGASSKEMEEIKEKFFKMIAELKFMPNSPTLMNAGEKEGQLSACFVVPIEDSMESIFDAVRATALIHKTGGGTGFSFSKLRSKNSIVKSTGSIASGPVSFMRVFDCATQAVKQGGRRRGANMGILRVDHPDILEFIRSKEKEGELSNFNISVAVTDEFVEKVLKEESYNLIDPHIMQVKGRLNAKEVFDLIATCAWKNGEPGLVFIDRINQTNPCPHLGEIESTNPCVNADTYIMTEEGPKKVYELLGKKFTAIVDGKKYQSTEQGFFYTGFKPIYKLKTKEGYEVKLTLEHPLLKVVKKSKNKIFTKWIQVRFLNKKDKILLNDHYILENWKGDLGYKEGYLIGLLIGDGTLKKDKAIISVWDNEGSDSIKEEVLKIAHTLPHRKDFKGWYKIKERGENRLALSYVKNVCLELDLKGGYKKITDKIEKCSSEFYKGFLKGLFDADGCITGNHKKGISIRLAQSDLDLLKGVQRMLLRLGIFSKIYSYRKKEGKKKLPNGKGGFKEYNVEAFHELAISKENIFRFYKKVGFGDQKKNLTLESFLNNYKRRLNKEFFIATVEEIVFEGMEEVYDVQIPGINIFDGNGFKLHNCGEQPLLPYESCNLGSINLAKMVKKVGSKFEVDWDSLGEVTKLAIRFLDNVIDANKFPLPQIRENTLRTRKIGLGIMGWATMLSFLGTPYDSSQALELGKKLMGFIYNKAIEESVNLAKVRGEFPAWRGSVWEKRGIKLRNATLTTIAPTGSISIIAGPTSTGIEPFYALCYFRNVLEGERLLEAEPSFEYVAKERGFYSPKLMERIANGESIQTMKEIPADVKRIFKTALEIEASWHIKMQATFQEWTDNAVSKTINFPNSAKMEDVKEAYMLAYKLGCKGITVYRDGSRTHQVLTREKKRPVKEEKKEIPVYQPKPRPEVIIGTTTKITTGCGNLYVTVNQDKQGNFFEVFTQMGKAGGCAASQLEAIGRLISLALRAGVDIKVIVEQLKGIRCPSPSWVNGKKIFSCADAIARILEKRIKDQKELIENSSFPQGCLSEVKGKEIVGNKETVVYEEKEGFSHKNIVGVCPECGSALIHQEGCLVCNTCGYSKC